MKVPVYLYTGASYYLGEVEINSEDKYMEAAQNLWEMKDYDSPTLCSQCSDTELGDWDISENHVNFYFKEEE